MFAVFRCESWGEMIWLGTYNTEEEAYSQYDETVESMETEHCAFVLPVSRFYQKV
jgi:hypothetical protein